MSRNEILNRVGFTQGIKRSLDSSVVPEDALWDARNVRVDQSGVLRIRRGFQTFTESLGAGVIQGSCVIGNTILIAWNRNLYRVSSVGIVTLLSTGTMGTTTVEFVPWTLGGAPIVYIFTGNGIYSLVGNTVTLITPRTPLAGQQPNLLRAADGTQDLTSVPARSNVCLLRVSLGQRLVVAHRNTIVMSAPLDATYFPADQVIQLPVVDEFNEITGLQMWYGALLIFRHSDIWVFFGDSVTDTSATLVQQKMNVGCAAPRTIAQVPDLGIVFLGEDNVYKLTNIEAVPNMATVEAIGTDIQPYLTDISQQGFSRHACAVWYNREYWLSIPEANIPLYRLSLNNNAGWYVDTSPRVVQFAVLNKRLVGAEWSIGSLIRLADVLYDKNIAIDFYVAFRREALLPGHSRIKRLLIYVMSMGQSSSVNVSFYGNTFNTQVHNTLRTHNAVILQGTNQHLKVSLLVDGKDFLLNTVPITSTRVLNIGVSDMTPVRVYEAIFHPTLQGHFVQVRINSVTAGEDIAVLGYGIEYEPALNMQTSVRRRAL